MSLQNTTEIIAHKQVSRHP